MKYIKIFLFAFLFICCFIFVSCNNYYYKEKIKTKGVVQEIISINNLTSTEPKIKLKVKIDNFDGNFYFITSKKVNIGDTIDIEIIFYKKRRKDNI